MSGNKLSQSLDQIMTDARKANPRRVPRRGARAAAKTNPGPVGGVQKNARAAKASEKAIVPTGPTRSGDGKIVVSNLPLDVAETQIKEYFHSTIGPVKKVVLTYGPNGQSRGIATITFVKHESAAKSAKELDGIKIDNRPMKIELVVGAKEAPAPIPPKSLGDRIGKPKNAAKDKPKPATTQKPAATNGKPAARGRPARRGGRTSGRNKPKTADELDAEMVDYFGDGGNPNGDATMTANGGAVQPVANGEAAMEDEIM